MPYNVFLYVSNSITPGTIVYTTNAFFSGTFWAFNGIQTTSNWVTNSPLNVNVIVTDSATTNTMANSINIAVSVYSPPTTPTLILSNTLIDQGQSILFTANIVAGQGTPPYTYAYNVYAYNTLNNGNFPIANMLFTGNSYTSNAWLWTPSNTYIGNSVFIANVLVKDTASVTANSVSNTFGYNAALVVSVALGAWQTTNALSSKVYYNSCTTSNGYIYCPGGLIGASLSSNIVQYAQILGTGALGAWQVATNALVFNVYENSCTSSNNYIYCPGGLISSHGSNVVQYAQVYSSGVVGTWSTTNALTFNAALNSCTALNGYVYCPGGSLRRWHIKRSPICTSAQHRRARGMANSNQFPYYKYRYNFLHLLQQLHLLPRYRQCCNHSTIRAGVQFGSCRSMADDKLSYPLFDL